MSNSDRFSFYPVADNDDDNCEDHGGGGGGDHQAPVKHLFNDNALSCLLVLRV